MVVVPGETEWWCFTHRPAEALCGCQLNSRDHFKNSNFKSVHKLFKCDFKFPHFGIKKGLLILILTLIKNFVNHHSYTCSYSLCSVWQGVSELATNNNKRTSKYEKV